ncbi:MAG: exonuclease SbcCD subunit D [Rhodothermaceae bacterium]
MDEIKKVKIVFLADSHLGFDYPVKPRIERRRRGNDFFDNFRKVLDYAVDTKADLVLHGGDFFFRAKVPQKIVDLSYSILLDFAPNNIPFVVVPGNHERSKMPVSIFLNHPNLFIFDVPKTFEFNINGARLSISGFPCERKDVKGKFSNLIKECKPIAESDIKLLLVHQTFEGSKVINYTFKHGKDIIPFQEVPEFFDAILSGHIHRQQVLVKNFTAKRVPVIYPGSIERTSFQERTEDKGFYEIIYTQRPNKLWKMKELNFIKLPTRPMVDIILDDSVNHENLEDVIRTETAKFPEDAIVRLKVNNENLIPYLTAEFLKQIFPATMNYELSGVKYYKK